MLTLDLLLLSPPWTIKFQGALALSTFLAFAYCKKFFSQKCMATVDLEIAREDMVKAQAQESLSTAILFFVYENGKYKY